MEKVEPGKKKKDILPIRRPKGERKEAKFLPVFILIPGFKVRGGCGEEGVQKRTDWQD